MSILVGAWHAIRRNAETSQTASTKEKAREFGHDLPKNLRKLQDKLRQGYKFEPAHGAALSKGPGKGKRPLVIAPLHDRIVQRAILDVLQQSPELTKVKAVLETPTSIGGIPGRGVDCAIKLIDHAWSSGCNFAAGSDIKGFFTKIPKGDVINFLTDAVPDPSFVSLVEKALTVELQNAGQMKADDLHLFPTGADGVAQGCPLSALAGNIVLRDFDRVMNDPQRGIVCIRYIDDFIILGKKADRVRKAMASAREHLNRLGMDIYDHAKHPKKAFIGPLSDHPEFLGHTLIKDRYPPAPSAQKRLQQSVTALLQAGKKAIDKALTGHTLKSNEKAFAATVVAVSNTLNGWKGSFRSSNCHSTFEAIDSWVHQQLGNFHAYLRTHSKGKPATFKNAALGIAPLATTPHGGLPTSE
jgi:retron-type reverse transcriptase